MVVADGTSKVASDTINRGGSYNASLELELVRVLGTSDVALLTGRGDCEKLASMLATGNIALLTNSGIEDQ